MKTMKIRANKAGNAMENAELQLQVSPDIPLWLRGTVVAALWSRGIAGGIPRKEVSLFQSLPLLSQPGSGKSGKSLKLTF